MPKILPNLAKKGYVFSLWLKAAGFVIANHKKYLNALFHIYIIMLLSASVKTSLAWFSKPSNLN